MSKEMREQIDRVKNWKQFLNENVDNDMYHYVIHTGLGNRLDTMGDLYWVKANKNILKSKVWSLFVSKHPELKNTEITQISKDTFDTNANEFEIVG